jgi:hypothetical protein
MAFFVGQKVVCVDGDGHWHYTITGEAARGPTKGDILTIRAFGEENGLMFVEWPGEDEEHDPEYFRPVVEKKTDISVFVAMLTPNKVKELT